MQTPKFNPGDICVITHPRSPLNGSVVVITRHEYNRITDRYTYTYKFQDDLDSKSFMLLDENYLMLKGPTDA